MLDNPYMSDEVLDIIINEKLTYDKKEFEELIKISLISEEEWKIIEQKYDEMSSSVLFEYSSFTIDYGEKCLRLAQQIHEESNGMKKIEIQYFLVQVYVALKHLNLLLKAMKIENETSDLLYYFRDTNAMKIEFEKICNQCNLKTFVANEA